MVFHNLNLQFPSLTSFAAWLRLQPRPDWHPTGVTYHNTYHPNAREWQGHTSMESMEKTYAAKGWDRGPHCYLALGTHADGIWVMTPPHLPGIHAGSCNEHRFGIEVVGDFENHPMVDAQLHLLADVSAELLRYAGATRPDINAHRDCMLLRTCPGQAAYEQKGDIQKRLASAMSTPAKLAHGIVLTNTRSIAILSTDLATGHYTALKVVTAWGLPSAWTQSDRQLVAKLPQTLIVRTHAGDPSSNKPFLHPEEVVSEIEPWYATRSDLWIELGNEPNSAALDPFDCRYYLGLAIAACREHFPKARLIAPALVLDRGDPQHWLAVCGDLYRQCEAIGVHIYAFTSLANDDTGQQALASKLYSQFSQPLALTEYGINDGQMGKAAKGSAYARFVQNLSPRYALATAYHIDQAAVPGTNDAYYHLTMDSHRAYGLAMLRGN